MDWLFLGIYCHSLLMRKNRISAGSRHPNLSRTSRRGKCGEKMENCGSKHTNTKVWVPQGRMWDRSKLRLSSILFNVQDLPDPKHWATSKVRKKKDQRQPKKEECKICRWHETAFGRLHLGSKTVIRESWISRPFGFTTWASYWQFQVAIVWLDLKEMAKCNIDWHKPWDPSVYGVTIKWNV